MPENAAGLEQDIFPGMLARSEPFYGGSVKVTGVISARWRCHRANSDLLTGALDLGQLGERIGPGIGSGGAVEVAPNAQLFGPIYLGQEVKIKPGVVIHGPSVIRDYTILDNQARVQHSIVWRNCYIGEGVMLHGAVVGRQCSIKERAVVFEGAVIGDGTVIGEDALVQPGVKIWPARTSTTAQWYRTASSGRAGRRVLLAATASPASSTWT